jgi:hypothetical protein
VPSGIAQEATAKTILESPAESSPAVLDAVIRHERRVRNRCLFCLFFSFWVLFGCHES